MDKIYKQAFHRRGNLNAKSQEKMKPILNKREEKNGSIEKSEH